MNINSMLQRKRIELKKNTKARIGVFINKIKVLGRSIRFKGRYGFGRVVVSKRSFT